jgi:hypothetical protein
MPVEEDLLVSDFHECFAQMRHYDDGSREMVKFGFEGVIAIVTAYAFLAKYLQHTKIVGAALTVLTGLGTVMGLLLVVWLTRNRAYYVIVVRYVNEVRSAYLPNAPAGVTNKAKIYTDWTRPPMFARWSTHILQIYVLSLCTALVFAGFVGTIIVVLSKSPEPEPLLRGDVWIGSPMAFFFLAVIQICWVLDYLNSVQNGGDTEALWVRRVPRP